MMGIGEAPRSPSSESVRPSLVTAGYDGKVITVPDTPSKFFSF